MSVSLRFGIFLVALGMLSAKGSAAGTTPFLVSGTIRVSGARVACRDLIVKVVVPLSRGATTRAAHVRGLALCVYSARFPLFTQSPAGFQHVHMQLSVTSVGPLKVAGSADVMVTNNPQRVDLTAARI